jgi:hypothetical protein
MIELTSLVLNQSLGQPQPQPLLPHPNQQPQPHPETHRRLPTHSPDTEQTKDLYPMTVREQLNYESILATERHRRRLPPKSVYLKEQSARLLRMRGLRKKGEIKKLPAL